MSARVQRANGAPKVSAKRLAELRERYTAQAEQYALSTAELEASTAEDAKTRPAREAAAAEARAEIAAAIAKLDANAGIGDRIGDEDGPGAYLDDAASGIVRALGLIALVRFDRTGFDPTDLDEPMREIAEAATEIDIARKALERAGVLAAKGE